MAYHGHGKTLQRKKKLNRHDITNALSDSEDSESDQIPVTNTKTKPTSLHTDASRSTLLMTFTRDRDVNIYSISNKVGENEKKESKSRKDFKLHKEDTWRRKSSHRIALNDERSSRHPRAAKNVPSYEEDVLSDWKVGVSTRAGKKRSKSPETVIKVNKREDVKVHEVDENSMCNANDASPSKRLKVVISDIIKTPSKTISLTSSPVKTPVSLRSQTVCKTPNTELKNMSLNSPCTSNKTSIITSARKNLNLSFKPNESVVKGGKAPYNDFDQDDTDEAQSEGSDDKDTCYNPDESIESSSEYSEEEINDSDSDENERPNYSETLRAKSKTSPKNILKTPSKRAPKTVTPSVETPTRQMSRLSLSGLTPSVRKRVSQVSKPTTPLQLARQKLHVSVLPKSLPCREEQFNDIYTFLTARLSDNTGGCIYISGVPGTGKTATVNEVIRILKKKMEEGSLPEFKYVDINGMKMSEPRQAYVQMWKQLTGESRTWEDAQKMLQERFSKRNSKRCMTLLLVDELDLLCTKRQDVIYNLLDWPSKEQAKLVVVTIANTMDLPERVFMAKVTSRLGLTRLSFPSYTYKQLEQIVVSRLKNQNAFDNDTIQLVARKVAAVSGDARRALDICRRSTEVAEVNGKETVTLAHVKQALDEMIASPKIQAIKNCSVMEKYFLQAVCAEVQRTGVQEVVFKNVYHHMKPLVSVNGENPPNITRALLICARLGSYRLLLTEDARQDIHQRIILNVDSDDVYFATKEIEI
ncbi:origin recognition complex subunit 1 isoform X2 [Copidosoma floridanum]|uniref:origin recognition complex subunit 1 isoform X2 n=1 Tax=Copidosoma floridanum TaxID=29053 RepID=UPI0006C98DBE|nr:origin recognition complex subunit 1 isoform X2 [Copidosoma floridanum]